MSYPAELPPQEEPSPEPSHGNPYLDAIEIVASRYKLPLPVPDLLARLTIWLDDPKGGTEKAIETLRSIHVHVEDTTIDLWSLVESTARDMQKSVQEKQSRVSQLGKHAVESVTRLLRLDR